MVGFSYGAALALALGYLLGSIPFGLILTRLAGAGDLRSIGSGNIGATNVLRTGRKGLAAATLVLDALKATLAVVLAAWLFGPATGACRGGRRDPRPSLSGVAQVSRRQGRRDLSRRPDRLAWPAAIAFALVWLAVAGATRYSSAAALAATAVSPLVALAFGLDEAAVVFGALAALVWFKHSANIARLVRGAEPKIGQG